MAFSGKPITAESCYIGADIDGTGKEGLFYACTWTGPFAVKDSYAINSDTAIPPFGHQAVTGINSYTTSASKDGFTQFDPALALGENAKTQMPKLNYNGVWVTAEGLIPRLKFFAVGYSATENDNLNNPVTQEPEKDYYGPWDGLVAENYAGGDGSKENPYQIATANQLAKLARSASANNHYTKPEDFTGGKYYVLTADIELNDTTEVNWYENGNLQEWKYYVTSTDNAFCGYLNGQGHTIKGLYINQEISANTYAGLFGALGKGAVIENLK